VVTYEEYSDDDLARVVDESERSSNDKRGPFERDRARIIHSAAFRKLQGKTQVYGLGASDYYRTRLTHSLEVAQIGKAIAMRTSADPALVEAICLAHDIGHPPFGHAAEQELNEAMKDVDGFNGNAQNIRIVTNIERKHEDYDGLNLTKATLDGLIKYPRPIDHTVGVEKGYYKGDENAVLAFRFAQLAEAKTFECEIMNWSDDVAYSSHDLEDALVIGTVRAEDLRSSEKRDRIFALAAKAYGKDYADFDQARPLTNADVETAVDAICRQCIERPGNRLTNIKMFVGNHINDCVTSVEAVERSGSQNFPRRYHFQLKLTSELVRRVEIYKAVTFACVIQTNSVLSLQQAGRRVARELYMTYSKETNLDLRYLYPDDWIPNVDQALTAVKFGGDEHALKRLARDYIGTMTDHFAEEQWKRLNLPGHGQLFVARA